MFGISITSHAPAFFPVWLALVVGLSSPVFAATNVPQVSLTDISPPLSTRYAAEYGIGEWGRFAAGGRVNNLASVPGTNQVFYAATEWGGLWKTVDGGDTWFQLAAHVPTAVWDVAVDPLDPD